MKPTTAILAALLGAIAAAAFMAPSAFAAQTQIAQVPLLNISGTGTVKPNLMLLFDNSTSMNEHHTPDYIDGKLCRSALRLQDGTDANLLNCGIGQPPFMSADFNRQYYNPNIRYQPPIKHDGTFYAEQNATATASWTNVISDGFGVFNKDLKGNNSSSINLVSGFPDLKWCISGSTTDCRVNTDSYTYPDNRYTVPIAISAGPYYYNIVVAEYCSDETLSNCRSTSPGATAPAGFPVPAKLRWCTTRALTTCQAKRVGTYVWPRYSQPISATGAAGAYGTIAIGVSGSTSSMDISSVTIADPTTARTIAASVTASTGTDTAAKQQALANALAAKIIATTGLTNQYLACVRTPTGGGVPACSTFGIPLAADNVVAVVAVTCSGAKSLSNCVPLNDNSRAGWVINVNAPTVLATPATTGQPPTGLLNIAGTTGTSGSPTITNVTMGGTTLATNIVLGRSANAATAVSKIVAAINASNVTNVRAYAGGNTITKLCAQQGAGTVCIVKTGVTSNGASVTAGSVSNSGSLVITPVNASSILDSIPTTTVPISTISSFVRVDLLPDATYPKTPDRVDCVDNATRCTYQEEMTNFANWYTYYKSRLQMMKSSVGIAFAGITGNYRVGFVRLSEMGDDTVTKNSVDMKPADFAGTSRQTWYSKLYGATTDGSTPVRRAMNNVGLMFSNAAPFNYATDDAVVQYACQPNFLILTTDGYWNGSSAPGVSNNDNKESPGRFCTQVGGCYDPRAQTQPSIADVALHWYNGGSSTTTVSLRPDLEPDMTRPGQVPAAGGENTHLHMNTYTLGLGMDGVMTYEQNYDTAPKPGGDFYKLITGVQTGCPWNNNGPYVWPDAKTSDTSNTVQERVDDLWHAAINGHGKYFSANEPKEVVQGLSSALANMQVSVGAAAAAATSTPNISLEDNDIFSDTFTTVKWYGELTDKKIDPATGIVGTNVIWNSSDTVGRKVSVANDTRRIMMLDPNGGTPALVDFTYGNLSAAGKAWFDNKCTLLAQCTLLSAADRQIVNNGTHLVNWLRGQQQHANDEIFRSYSVTVDVPGDAVGALPIVLGDIVSSKPAYMRDPRKSYSTTGYAEYKAANAQRPGVVFAAANDGMLHAFDAAGGEELWAYVPRISMKKLYNLAGTTYGTNHIFTTDGSPELGDVQINGVWKTVLVAGMNGGGRGFYALDVTNPRPQPAPLWELCADPTVCSNSDPDIGLTFGNPQYGMWRGKWVVFLTSGYNNVPGVDNVNTGDGKGYLFIVDVRTGAILKKVSTNSGDTTTPSGLAKITAISADPASDPVVTYIYGGDNQGQMWRFDLSNTGSDVVNVLKMGDAGPLQPITTRPDVTVCSVPGTDGGSPTTPQRVVLFGTGRLLDIPDTTSKDTQSLYLLKDSGSSIAVRGSAMVEQTLSLKGSGSNVNTYAITSNPVDLSQKSGWFFDWKLNVGERMNLDPKIVSGIASAVTNMPTSSSACSVGGTSNSYQVDVCTGHGANGDIAGTTLSSTSAAVGFIIIRLPNGELKKIVTTADGKTKTEQMFEGVSAAPSRAGWRRVKGD